MTAWHLQTEDDSLNGETKVAATIRQFCDAVNGNECT
jgi:hypothetical protein